MPNTLSKNLNLCLSLIKRPQPQITLSPQHPLHFNNYNSLFEEDFNSPIPLPPPINTTSYGEARVSGPASPSSISTDYMETEDTSTAVGPITPDLTAAYASCRFFISSPGRSNSIVDSLSLSSSNLLLSLPAEEEEAVEVAGGVPVQTYSPDPYVDFRRSMQEMVEARDLGILEVKEAWDYLQKLLLTYLALNPKSTHKYIVGAFTDLVLNLMSPNNHRINHNNTNHNPSSSSSSSSFSSSSVNGGGYVLS